MSALFRDLQERHGRFFVFDLHAYNHRRAGPDAPAADPEANREVNIGTGTMDRAYWAPVVDRFIADLRSFDFLGRHLDVRENVKFVGRGFPRFVHETFPRTGCAGDRVQEILHGCMDGRTLSRTPRSDPAGPRGDGPRTAGRTGPDGCGGRNGRTRPPVRIRARDGPLNHSAIGSAPASRRALKRGRFCPIIRSCDFDFTQQGRYDRRALRQAPGQYPGAPGAEQAGAARPARVGAAAHRPPAPLPLPLPQTGRPGRSRDRPALRVGGRLPAGVRRAGRARAAPGTRSPHRRDDGGSLRRVPRAGVVVRRDGGAAAGLAPHACLYPAPASGQRHAADGGRPGEGAAHDQDFAATGTGCPAERPAACPGGIAAPVFTRAVGGAR